MNCGQGRVEVPRAVRRDRHGLVRRRPRLPRHQPRAVQGLRWDVGRTASARIIPAGVLMLSVTRIRGIL